jgi:choline dehydrogenase-like flavoprotein
MPGPTVAAALRATTPAVLRTANAYDALVIGAGAAGGLAALLLAEAGVRVLVLEAGPARAPGSRSRAVSPLLEPVALEILRRRQPIQSRCHVWEFDPEAFVDDLDYPYITPPDRPFVWLRARQLGGRMVVPGHGQQYYRLGPDDFVCSDGPRQPWPLRACELDPWYAFVERRLGLAGMRDNVPWLPDSELAHMLNPGPAEAALQRAIAERWPSARPVLGRFAPPLDALEAAAMTGRLLIRTGAIAREIEVDRSGHVLGVVWIDQQTRSEERARAPLVFLCASTLESTRLLLLSRSGRSPEGLGAASGALGRYLMDHVKVQARGQGPPQSQRVRSAQGRCLYLPRFDARELPAPRPGPGFGVQVYQWQATGEYSQFGAASFAEMLPRRENRVTLDSEQRDVWGIPVLRIDCTHGDEELMRAREQIAALRELAELAGVTLTGISKAPEPPGFAIHETGTARMGSEPASSVLDPHNQCWDAQGLYVTDGACFPSQGSQNPTLTILALTARACDHALRSNSLAILPAQSPFQKLERGSQSSRDVRNNRVVAEIFPTSGEAPATDKPT